MATEQQIPVIAARLVEYQKEFSRLPSEDAQWLMNHTKEAISIFVNAVINRAEPAVQIITNLLSCFFSTFTVLATTEKFVAKDKFKVDVGEKAKVKIAYLGDNFKDWFLGKIEDPFIGSIIYGRKLGKDSVDGPILEKLGGNEAAEITLTEIYAAMEAQPNGESGNLRNNKANIFYVKDIIGTLRVVRVHWSGVGWDVGAFSVGRPDGWNVGIWFFTRSPVVLQVS